jgi:hypothetical protein
LDCALTFMNSRLTDLLDGQMTVEEISSLAV